MSDHSPVPPLLLITFLITTLITFLITLLVTLLSVSADVAPSASVSILPNPLGFVHQETLS
jgi:hypothetical protein